MKRQAFVLSGAGAALAGCAGTALSPNSLVNSASAFDGIGHAGGQG